MKGQQAIGTLVIFIALVITAALASFVIVSTTNALQSKSLAVASKTMEKATMGFAARAVEGLSTNSAGDIEYLMLQIELAPGSDTIDLKDVTLIYQAAGGTVYQEYKFADSKANLDSSKIGKANPFDPTTLEVNKFYVVDNRSHWDKDEYVESGELYTIAIKLPDGKPLNEGEDWKIIVRAPYTQDLIVTGYAPEVIQEGQVVTLKSA